MNPSAFWGNSGIQDGTDPLTCLSFLQKIRDPSRVSPSGWFRFGLRLKWIDNRDPIEDLVRIEVFRPHHGTTRHLCTADDQGIPERNVMTLILTDSRENVLASRCMHGPRQISSTASYATDGNTGRASLRADIV